MLLWLLLLLLMLLFLVVVVVVVFSAYGGTNSFSQFRFTIPLAQFPSSCPRFPLFVWFPLSSPIPLPQFSSPSFPSLSPYPASFFLVPVVQLLHFLFPSSFAPVSRTIPFTQFSCPSGPVFDSLFSLYFCSWLCICLLCVSACVFSYDSYLSLFVCHGCHFFPCVLLFVVYVSFPESQRLLG